MQKKMNVWWLLNNKQFTFDQLKLGDFPDGLSEFEKQTLDFGHAWSNGTSHFELPTSGSTGDPKTIVIHRNQMEASARLTEMALGLRAGYTSLNCLDSQRIAGKMMLVRSLVTGMNIVATEPSANPFDKIQNDIPIDFAALVPYQLQAILSAPSSIKRLNELKTVIIGGAPVDEKLRTLVTPLKCRVYATYGMTETISHIALQKLNGSQSQDCFHVLPGIFIESDPRGCLTIAAEYLGAGKIATNDLVEILSPRQFRWLGRADHVINSGGVKIIPEKIEKEVGKIFHALGLENRFFISGIPDPKLGTKVILVVEGDSLDKALAERIHKSLGGVMPKHEAPKEILAVKNFVETETQKINRKATLEELKGKS